jgi:uncharacterized cupin superfamily protein
MAKKIDLATAPSRIGSGYPSPYDAPCRERGRLSLGQAAGLTQFGVNLLRLPPGHWHSHEDEFVHVLEGEVVLVTDAGEELLRAGDSAGFRAGDADGHHLQNRSQHEAVLLEIGSRMPEDVTEYPEADLRALPAGYVHKNGTPYGVEPKKA